MSSGAEEYFGFYSVQPGTSAAQRTRSRAPAQLISATGALAVSNTTVSTAVWGYEKVFAAGGQTSSGLRVEAEQSAASVLMELRRLSGLTWEQLAHLCGASRRSLHFWASGKPLSPAHEERLSRLLAVMRRLDRGAAADNRNTLLEPVDGGGLLIDLLAAGRLDEALAIAGEGRGRTRPALTPLSRTAIAARAPQPPNELLGALQDRIGTKPKKSRPARSRKVRRK